MPLRVKIAIFGPIFEPIFEFRVFEEHIILRARVLINIGFQSKIMYLSVKINSIWGFCSN